MDLFKKLIFILMLLVLHFELKAEEIKDIKDIKEIKEIKKIKEYSIANTFTFQSKILGEERSILVSLPSEYDQTNDTYPVHVILDGKQNIEHAVATSRMLSNWAGLPKSIIVGIPSVNRNRDFTPSKDVAYSPESGGAKKFADFLEKEVMTFVDKKYRTHPFRVLTGHSLGGLFAVNQYLKKNPSFNAYIIVAPSLWWNKQKILSTLAKAKPTELARGIPVYLGVGEEDGMTPMVEQLYRLFTENNASHRYAYTVYENEGHMSAPMKTFYDGIKHVFSDAVYDESKWESFTSDSFIEFTESIKHNFGSSVKQTGELYNKLANFLATKKNYAGAITVLKANVQDYPNYAFNHKDLANAYALNGNVDQAISEFQKAADIARKDSSSGQGDALQYEREINRLRNPITLSEQVLKGFAGCYKSKSGTVFKFSLIDDVFTGHKEGWPDFQLYAESDNGFYTRLMGLAPSFKFNANRVDVIANGQTYPLPKTECKANLNR
ncbi:alpha/beta hydrolase-fold protein [Pseudoalteromonas phenolica]|uniref:alpha/beta hydrolase-fold protein n=1 Tax=Pseudoalteromonas phenolica TaxID=161398 RepID=UPI00110AC50A|nr:alpha/beta hydrolase-fold protein [Pseudoalteromonas phenolica]